MEWEVIWLYYTNELRLTNELQYKNETRISKQVSVDCKSIVRCVEDRLVLFLISNTPISHKRCLCHFKRKTKQRFSCCIDGRVFSNLQSKAAEVSLM